MLGVFQLVRRLLAPKRRRTDVIILLEEQEPLWGPRVAQVLNYQHYDLRHSQASGSLNKPCVISRAPGFLEVGEQVLTIDVKTVCDEQDRRDPAQGVRRLMMHLREEMRRR